MSNSQLPPASDSRIGEYQDETDYRNRVNDALRNQTVSPDQRDDEYWQELDANGCLI